MSRSIVTKSLAAAAIMGLFAAHAATAQQTQPPKCTTHFVYFATGSHALTPEDQDHIRDVAAMMQSTPTFVATIVGKTDSVGSADFNEHLSQRRAEAVFEALVYANKVSENRVQLRWTGERLPSISTADEKAKSQNRMTAIIVSDPGVGILWRNRRRGWAQGAAQGHDRLCGGAEGHLVRLRRKPGSRHHRRSETHAGGVGQCRAGASRQGPGQPVRRVRRYRDRIRRQDADDPQQEPERLYPGRHSRLDRSSRGRVEGEVQPAASGRRPADQQFL